MIIKEIREILGERLFARFMIVFGGTDVRFPKKRSAISYAHMIRVVGEGAALRLRDRFVGSTIYIPRNASDERARRDDEIAARIASGEKPADVARSYRVVATLSERHVRRILGRVGMVKEGKA